MRAVMRVVVGVFFMCGALMAQAQVYRCVTKTGSAYAITPTAGATCKAVKIKTRHPTNPSAPGNIGMGNHSPATPPSSPEKTATPPPKRPASTGVKRLRTGRIFRTWVNGVAVYTNVGSKKHSSSVMVMNYRLLDKCYACGGGVDFAKDALNSTAFDVDIQQASNKHGVEEALIRSIIHAESHFQPQAVSRAGAQGLMQLIPSTANRFGVSDAFNARANIDGGTRYLAWLMKRYHSNISLVASAYNAGEGAVDQYNGIPPYQETQQYVERVNTLLQRYRTAL